MSSATSFLSPLAADPGHHLPLRTPIDGQHRAAGAGMVERHGWRVATYPPTEATVWAADACDLGKVELRGSQADIDRVTRDLGLGESRIEGRARVARLTPARALVLCPFSDTPVQLLARGPAALDLTCAWAAVRVGGPSVRALFSRISGLDVRPGRFGVGGVMLGSVARCPAIVVNEGQDTLLVLVGWEYGAYLWETVHDAGAPLGVVPATNIEATA